MKMTIRIPLFLGAVLGLLDFACWAGNFIIPLGPYGATGPQEIFITMSAALGGPIGLFVTAVFHEMGNYLFGLEPLFSPEQISSSGIMYTIADFSAHILAALTIAFGYKRIYRRVDKLSIFVGAWILMMAIYYLFLVSLQFFLIGLVIELPTLVELFNNFLPEFIVVMGITTLILIALQSRYIRPQWFETEKSHAAGS